MGVIKLGFLHTALHAGCASAVARVIEAHGFEVDYVDLTRGDVKDALFTNQLDIYASTWLPMDDDLLNGNYRAVGDLYQPLPSWLSVGDVVIGENGAVTCDAIYAAKSIRHLYADALQAFERTSHKDVTIIDDETLYHQLNHAAQQNQRVLVAAMQPHAAFFDARFQLIESGLPALGAPMRAPLLISENLAECGDPDLFDELSEMMLGVKVMSALDYAITVEGVDPEDAAESWQRGRLIPR